jgi:hypothetical protein
MDGTGEDHLKQSQQTQKAKNAYSPSYVDYSAKIK